MKLLVSILILASVPVLSYSSDFNVEKFSKLEFDFNSSQEIKSAIRLGGTWYAKSGAEKIVFSTGKADMISSWETNDPYKNASRGGPTLSITATSNKEIKVIDYTPSGDIERYNFDENLLEGSLFFKGYSRSYSEVTEQTVTWDIRTECRTLNKMKNLICSRKSTNLSSGGYNVVYTMYVR